MDRGGFTLIELMVVVAIVGIIGSFAVPSLQTYVRQSRRTGAYIDLAGICTAQKVYHMEHDQYGPTFGDVGFDISGTNEIDPTTIKSQLYAYTLGAFAVDSAPNEKYRVLATRDLDPDDDMLDIVMIEGGVLVLE